MNQPDFSAPAERNKQPILDVLRQVLPERGRALEIASGTGQHVVWFAAHLPQWSWQPSDAQAEALNSIRARIAQEHLTNVRAPVRLDVMATHWLPTNAYGEQLFDLIYCANMLHIAPWATCIALMFGTARHLAPGGRLVTYGPYLEDEVQTSEGNLAFDKSLRARDASWGIRRRADVEQEARHAGLQLAQRFAMPANNLCLVWTRAM
jgi:SAM-dependent methyltransferase